MQGIEGNNLLGSDRKGLWIGL